MRKYPFSCYSFIRQEAGTWVSLGLICDDTAGDLMRFDYTLPMSGGYEQEKAEKLALRLLAETARLTLPAEGINNINVQWKVSSEEVKNQILNDEEMISVLSLASRYWEVCLMSDEQLNVFNKEIENGSDTETEEG